MTHVLLDGVDVTDLCCHFEPGDPGKVWLYKKSDMNGFYIENGDLAYEVRVGKVETVECSA